MTDAIDRLIAIKERLETVMVEQVALEEKQQRERERLNSEASIIEKDVVIEERNIALASALAALKAASSDVRHERVRQQINGAREQVRKALGA